MKKPALRIQDVFALFLIGDAVMSILRPKAHARLWTIGPEPLREGMESLESNPGLMLASGAIELAAGLWLATSAED